MLKIYIHVLTCACKPKTNNAVHGLFLSQRAEAAGKRVLQPRFLCDKLKPPRSLPAQRTVEMGVMLTSVMLKS